MYLYKQTIYTNHTCRIDKTVIYFQQHISITSYLKVEGSEGGIQSQFENIQHSAFVQRLSLYHEGGSKAGI